MTWTLAFAGVATLAAAGFFVRVGFALRSRRTSRADDERAVRAFSTWWLALGGSTACTAMIDLAATLVPPPTIAVALLRGFSLAFLSVAFWGLLVHVAYVYSGRDASRPLAIVYAALTAAVLAHLVYAEPVGVTVTPWTAEVLAGRPAVAWVTPLFVLAYLFPPLVASIAYARLVPRATDAGQRARLLATGIGLALWLSSYLLARLSDADLWQFVTRVAIGLAVAIAIWRAYFPAPSGVPPNVALDERLRQLI